MAWCVSAVLLVCALAFTMLPAASAQDTTGGIKVYVKDKSGASIPNAQLEVTSTALLGAKKGGTDSAGYYYFQALPPGDYNLTVSTAPNFRTYKETAIQLLVGKLPTIEVTLEIGSKAETIEVTGRAPLVDVTSVNVVVDIPQEVIDTFRRDVPTSALIPFAPGAVKNPCRARAITLGATHGFQIDGASDSENTYPRRRPRHYRNSKRRHQAERHLRICPGSSGEDKQLPGRIRRRSGRRCQRNPETRQQSVARQSGGVLSPGRV